MLVSSISDSATPVKNPNVTEYREAFMMGGEHSYFYFEGQDTISPAGGVDSTGFDSIMTTGPLNVGWLDADSMGTYPNWTKFDSVTWQDPTMCWLWLRADSNSYVDGTVTGYGEYILPDDPDSAIPDSVGFAKIIVQYMLNVDDSDNSYSAWFADTSNVVAQDGKWNSEDYGIWTYEELIGPISTARMIGAWWIYNIKIPPSGIIDITIESVDDMRETPIYKWRVVCAH
jgi:hypothetical protein